MSEKSKYSQLTWLEEEDASLFDAFIEAETLSDMLLSRIRGFQYVCLHLQYYFNQKNLYSLQAQAGALERKWLCRLAFLDKTDPQQSDYPLMFPNELIKEMKMKDLLNNDKDNDFTVDLSDLHASKTLMLLFECHNDLNIGKYYSQIYNFGSISDAKFSGLMKLSVDVSKIENWNQTQDWHWTVSIYAGFGYPIEIQFSDIDVSADVQNAFYALAFSQSARQRPMSLHELAMVIPDAA